MNHYGRQAMEHWKAWRPQAYAAIPDPETFFMQLGQRVQSQIVEMSADLAGDDPPGETYTEKLERLNMARMRAEETVLAEEVLLPPGPGVEPTEQQDQDPQAPWTPLVEDTTSPYWAGVSEREQETNGPPTQ